ncbi:hypothetical protein [Metabacillus litoralis]|uniref:Replication protein n=1 Tax=Metabacillus litoralis TaxID=152268 RepID=A0A179STZ1_9BACI|nr:hypothetical protein [Metabacillus litoralis]OAS85095.1 hypothetical protein A6K24_06180 [Metabacillus litoralis]
MTTETKTDKKKTFEVQIPNQIIRSPKVDCTTFFVYAKLVQRYWYYRGEKDTLIFDHNTFKYYANIKNNKKLKEVFNNLYQMKLIHTKVDELSRNGKMEIEINPFFDLKKVDKKKEDRYFYAQLPYILLDKGILSKVGYIGIRLLYYYKSYINNHKKTITEPFCFTSMETIQKETGISENTIIKYNEILKKAKLLKIVRHQIEYIGSCEYDEFGNEQAKFQRFNNHYYLRFDKFNEVHEKLSKVI